MTSFTSRYGNPADDYQGAHIWTHCRHSTTVVAVAGNLDAANIGHVSDHIARFIDPDTPLVLDLTGVTGFTPESVSLLDTVQGLCAQAGVQWALVAGDTVTNRLAAGADYPAAGSVAEAEHCFDDAILARRRGLLPLFAKSA